MNGVEGHARRQASLRYLVRYKSVQDFLGAPFRRIDLYHKSESVVMMISLSAPDCWLLSLPTESGVLSMQLLDTLGLI